jgi:NAD+ synthase
MNFAVGRVSETGLPLAYVNLVGGQDELVFDGGSFILNRKHALKAQAKAWEPQLVLSKWALKAEGWTCNEGTLEINTHDTVGQLHAIYHAIVLGLRDYVNKNSFPGVIMGLSGGIDSALSAAVAVDAIGSENVHCVMMPSPFTSQESLEDAAEIAGILGVAYDIIPIHEAMTAFDKMLTSVFQNHEADATEENIQARARGMIVMALSNKLGYLPLTTGNKSEMSVGYATLYGDMCGGYSVLKDIYKTTVFAISRWRNEIRPSNVFGGEGCVIPERIISKKPSAELKPDQFDEDTLPPYEVLDDILKNLIEGEQAISDIVARGHDPNVVRRVWHMLDRAEYKRRQAPPGVKISSRSFGRDRRYPITNGFTNLL